MNRRAFLGNLGKAAAATALTGLAWSCKTDDPSSQVQGLDTNLSFTVSDPKQLGQTLSNIIYKLGQWQVTGAAKTDVSVTVNFNNKDIEFRFFEDLVKFGCLLENGGGALLFSAGGGSGRTIADFRAVNVTLNLKNYKNVNVFNDDIYKNDNGQWWYPGAYDRSVYLLKHYGLDVNIVGNPDNPYAATGANLLKTNGGASQKDKIVSDLYANNFQRS